MKNADMLVKLYDLSSDDAFIREQANKGIEIRQPRLAEKADVLAWVGQHFSQGWVKEATTAFRETPPTCFIARQHDQIIGFCCYDTSALGFCGPIGVEAHLQKQGTGRALLLASLLTMKEKGYGYAIIGWVQEKQFAFYEKTVGATEIPNSFPGIYKSRLTKE